MKKVMAEIEEGLHILHAEARNGKKDGSIQDITNEILSIGRFGMLFLALKYFFCL